MKRELPLGTLVIAKSDSNNEKIGNAATTYAAQASCPRDCVFFDGGGCYAEDGPVGKFVTEPLNRAAGAVTPVEVARAEARAIDELPVAVGRPLRLHTVGDCPDDECATIVARAAERYMERGGGAVWTYTHAWRVVERKSWGRVSVLASCETVGDVQRAHERGYATAIVVEEFPGEKLYEIGSAEEGHPHAAAQPAGAAGMDGGRRVGRVARDGDGLAAVAVLPCPAQTRNIPCTECRLCFQDGARFAAGVTIGFAIHGTPLLQRKARKALSDPDDPHRKLTSRVLIPRFQDEFRAQNGREPTGAEIARALDLNSSSVYEMLKSIRLGGPARPARRGRRSRR